MKELCIGIWFLVFCGAMAWGYVWLADKWPMLYLLPVVCFVLFIAYGIGTALLDKKDK